jgi:sugar lactone lactonase YvrE
VLVTAECQGFGNCGFGRVVGTKGFRAARSARPRDDAVDIQRRRSPLSDSLTILAYGTGIGREHLDSGLAEILLDANAVTAESPLWDDREQSLLWVDVHSKSVHRLDGEGASRVWAGEARVGFVALSDDDRMVIGTGDRILIAGDNADTELWRCRELVPGGRFNDAKCDAAGRLWAGTMAQDETPGAGALYRITSTPTGSVETRRCVTDVTVSNGLAWSAGGDTMYYVDSPTGRVDAFSFDRDDGALHSRRPFVHIPTEEGEPDGITIDVDGCVWVAIWGGWQVRRFTPSGDLDCVVRVPVEYPTSCTFGGSDLHDLYITSSSFRVAPEQRAEQPLAGGIFAWRAATAGVRADRFAVRG